MFGNECPVSALYMPSKPFSTPMLWTLLSYTPWLWPYSGHLQTENLNSLAQSLPDYLSHMTHKTLQLYSWQWVVRKAVRICWHRSRSHAQASGKGCARHIACKWGQRHLHVQMRKQCLSILWKVCEWHHMHLPLSRCGGSISICCIFWCMFEGQQHLEHGRQNGHFFICHTRGSRFDGLCPDKELWVIKIEM